MKDTNYQTAREMELNLNRMFLMIGDKLGELQRAELDDHLEHKDVEVGGVVKLVNDRNAVVVGYTERPANLDGWRTEQVIIVEIDGVDINVRPYHIIAIEEFAAPYAGMNI